MTVFLNGCESLFGWLLRVSGQASVLILLIFLIQAVFGRRLASRWRYVLWLLVVARLLMPFSPASSVSIFNLTRLKSSAPPVAKVAEAPASAGIIPQTSAPKILPEREAVAARIPAPAPTEQSAIAPAAQGQTVTQVSPSWRHVFTMLWLLGLVILGLRLICQNLVFYWRLRWEPTVTSAVAWEVLEECRQLMGVRYRLVLVETSLAHSPALYGFLRIHLLLPEKTLAAFTPEELRYVFLHELAHVKRRDMLVNWLITILQVAHWFNPLIWLAFRRMTTDRELAADALALSCLEPRETVAYGQAIVKLLQNLLSPAPLPGLVGILEDKSQMKRRMSMIAKFKKTDRWPVLAIITFASLALIALTDAQNRPVSPPVERTSWMVNQQAVAGPQANQLDAPDKALSVVGSDLFVDPKTGIKFKKLTAVTGPSDIIRHPGYLQLSPNRKFLLDGNLQIIPLNGGEPFKPVDLPHASSGCYSPDGGNIAFWSGSGGLEGAIWAVPVDPATARATGPAKKLIECENQGFLRWLPDSERVLFNRFDKEIRGGVWTVSIKDGALVQISDFSTVGIRSPDGETIVYSEDPLWAGKPMWVKNTKGGLPRKIADCGDPWCWSVDGKWIQCARENRFIRLADGHEVKLETPAEVGYYMCSSLWGGNMYFYRASYEWRDLLKVVSVLGGPTCEPGMGMNLQCMYPRWWPDSRAIFVDERKNNDLKLWALPLAGGQPMPFKLDVTIPGTQFFKEFSPSCNHLLIAAYQPDQGVLDVWVVPVSWQEMRAIGPAVLVYKGWHGDNFAGRPYPAVWSPDGKQIALAELRSLYLVPAVGGRPVALIKTAEAIDWLDWSPDGKTIAFHQRNGQMIQAVSASGGEAKNVCPMAQTAFGRVIWSPDSQALIVARDQAILYVSITDGSTRSLVRLKELGKKDAVVLLLSPDGKNLTFAAGKENNPDQVFLLHMETGQVDPLSSWAFEPALNPCWSPNSKWISYYTYPQAFKIGSEGVLWEMNVADALAKLVKN
jgi:beta-lactamase regulating signal transducer with metallopeptidase domain/Tol biopolymer transport system component